MSHNTTYEEHPRPVHKRDGFKAWIVLLIAVAATYAWLAYMVATMTPGTATQDTQTTQQEAWKPGTPFPPCVTEDGPPPCIWDAAERGNGKGRSFTILPNGDVSYSTDAVKAHNPDNYREDLSETIHNLTH